MVEGIIQRDNLCVPEMKITMDNCDTGVVAQQPFLYKYVCTKTKLVKCLFTEED